MYPYVRVDQALNAVEGDTVPAQRERWSSALRRDPNDRSAMFALGTLARLTYDYAVADSLLGRVVTLRNDDAFADYARLQLGGGLVVRGKFREAMGLYEAAVASAERRADTVLLAEALLELANARARVAPPAEVLTMVDRAERLAQGVVRVVAAARCQRAGLLSRLGRDGAREMAESGTELAWRAREPRLEARCWHALGQTFLAKGDMQGADTALGRATVLFRQTRDRAALAALLQWRGYFFHTLGLTNEAHVRLTEAVAEGERSQAMSAVGWALISLGNISTGMGDNVAARDHLERAVSVLQEQGDEWGAVTARSSLAGVAMASGEVEAARNTLQEVLAWANRTGHVQQRFRTYNTLGSIAMAQRDWDEAGHAIDSALAIAERHRMTGFLNSMNYATGLLALRRGDLAASERGLRAYLGGLSPVQYGTRYKTRALLAEIYVKRGAIELGEAELIAATEEVDRWRGSVSDREIRLRVLEDLDYGSDPDLGVATVIATLSRAGRVEPTFELADRRRARVLIDEMVRAATLRPSGDSLSTRTMGATAAQAKAALPDDNTALLEYVTGRGEEPTTLFVVTRTRVTSFELATIDSLEPEIQRFSAVVEGRGDARPIATRLGAALLGAAVDALDPRITRLVIVPDDIIARVPFDALALGDGRFAVERFAIGLVPSAGAWLALREREAGGRRVRILAMGDPRFAAPSVGATMDREDRTTTTYRSAFDGSGGLEALPFSGREARNVARFAPDAEVRLGGDASEAYLREASLASFTVLHFATHALVDEQTATRTALALAPGNGHDGFLGPSDIAALSLGADLVVLSACRTAGGVVIKGEGVQGLTAPWLQAGARSVVATGWRIADESAGRIVEGLYRGLASGLPVVDALREAKLAALHDGAPPAEWAAFVSVGDPMVRIPLVTPGGSMAGSVARRAALAVLLIVLLAYGWRMWKRRGREVA